MGNGDAWGFMGIDFLPLILMGINGDEWGLMARVRILLIPMRVSAKKMAPERDIRIKNKHL